MGQDVDRSTQRPGLALPLSNPVGPFAFHHHLDRGYLIARPPVAQVFLQHGLNGLAGAGLLHFGRKEFVGRGWDVRRLVCHVRPSEGHRGRSG